MLQLRNIQQCNMYYLTGSCPAPLEIALFENNFSYFSTNIGFGRYLKNMGNSVYPVLQN